MNPSHRLKASCFTCALLLALSLSPLSFMGAEVVRFRQTVQNEPARVLRSPTAARIFDRDSVKRNGLDAISKTRLEEAKTRGDHKVSYIVASQRNKNAKVLAHLKRLGGEVVFQADDVDYIRGNLPTAKVEEFAADENVMDVSIGEGSGPAPMLDQDEALKISAAHYQPADFLPAVEMEPEPAPGDPDSPLKREAPKKPLFPLGTQFSPELSGDKHSPTKSFPLNELAMLNPYLPTYLIGAPQFIQRHPYFDGRGVTIAILGGVGDVDHPMLQYGRLLDGTIVNKVVDILDPSMRSTVSLLPDILKQIVTEADCSFTVEGQKYFAPRCGSYRFGIINSGEWSSNPKLAGGLAVIWDEARNLVWIDANKHKDFRIVTAITDY